MYQEYMILSVKLQAFPETPPYLFGTRLGTRTPSKGVKLLIYMENRWRG